MELVFLPVQHHPKQRWSSVGRKARMSIRRLLAVSVTLLLQGNPWTVAKGELAWKVKGVKMLYMPVCTLREGRKKLEK